MILFPVYVQSLVCWKIFDQIRNCVNYLRKMHEAVSSGGSLQLTVPDNIYIYLICQNCNLLKEFLNFCVGFMIARIGFASRESGCDT